MASRLHQLQEFYNDDPSDPFNLYALALEYQKEDLRKALALLNQLRLQHADYLPTYYHLGKLYQTLQENEQAIEAFDQGIDQAVKQQQPKTLRELNAAKQELLFDE